MGEANAEPSLASREVSKANRQVGKTAGSEFLRVGLLPDRKNDKENVSYSLQRAKARLLTSRKGLGCGVGY